MAEVELFGIPQSTYVWSARIALAEKGVPYELKVVPPHSDEIRALQPFGKVPALRHGSTVLFECQAIMRYVDERFDGPKLQPEDVTERARMTQWMSAAADTLYDSAIRKLVVPRALGHEIDEGVMATNLEALGRHLAVFNHGVSGRSFLAGDAFSLADALLAPMVAALQITPEGKQAFGSMTELGRWFQSVASRDSFGASAPPAS